MYWDHCRIWSSGPPTTFDYCKTGRHKAATQVVVAGHFASLFWPGTSRVARPKVVTWVESFNPKVSNLRWSSSNQPLDAQFSSPKKQQPVGNYRWLEIGSNIKEAHILSRLKKTPRLTTSAPNGRFPTRCNADVSLPPSPSCWWDLRRFGFPSTWS